MKKVLAIFLAVVMLLSAAPLSGFVDLELPKLTASAYEYPIAHGTFGDLQYDEFDTYIRISACDSSATSVKIPAKINGKPVKEISHDDGGYFSGAFYHCSKLKSVTIPNTVTYIGVRAFADCSALESIIIPDSVTYIGYKAFYDCRSLKNVTIGKGVTGMDSRVFQNCTSLQSITIPSFVTNIDKETFFNCKSLKSVTFLGNVETIGYNAFSGCSSLESITLPDSVTSIGGEAFYGCSSLQSITLPDSVTSIGSSAFSGCSSLQSITIPNSLRVIQGNTFGNCQGLESVMVGKSVKSIVSNAFTNCIRLKTVFIPIATVSIESNAFAGCKSISDIYYMGTSEQWDYIGIASNNTYFLKAEVHFNHNPYIHCTHADIEYIDEVPATCTTDGYTAGTYCKSCKHWFSGHEIIKSNGHDIVILPGTPATCTEMGISDGKKCSVCETLIEGQSEIAPLGHNVVVIPGKAATCTEDGISDGKKCSACDEIFLDQNEIPAIGHNYEEVTTPATCTEGGFTTRTCKNCENVVKIDETPAKGHTISNWIVEKAATVDAEGLEVKKCTECGNKLEERAIPKLAKKNHVLGKCGPNVSYDLNLDDGSMLIYGQGNMYNEDYYTYNDIESLWGDYSGKIKSITIQKGVTNIGYSAFIGCTYLSSISIPDSVKSIDDFAFTGCLSLESITIPKSVTDISVLAVFYCTSLSNFTVDADNKEYSSVDGVLFNKYKTKLVKYPEGKADASYTIPNTVIQINTVAFEACESLKSITIPDSVESIARGAFDGCISITTVNYLGTKDQWKNISIGEGNEYLTSAKINCAADTVDYIIGDINGDGKITATDARVILRISTKLEKLEDQKVPIFAAADVNGDGKLTATDARKVLRVSTKLESFGDNATVIEPTTEAPTTEAPTTEALSTEAFANKNPGKAYVATCSGFETNITDEHVFPLIKELENYVASLGTGYGVPKLTFYYTDVNRQYYIKYNSNVVHRTQSTIKAPYVKALLKYMEDNNIPLTKSHTLYDSHKWSSQYMSGYASGTSFTVQEIIYNCIRRSDNTAYQMLFDYYGNKIFNDNSERIGASLRLNSDIFGETSSEDMAKLFLDIYDYYQTGSPYAQFLIDEMCNTYSRDRIPRGVPSDIPVAQKIGTGGSATLGFHDCAIIFSDVPCVLTIFTTFNFTNGSTRYPFGVVADYIVRINKSVDYNI